MTAAATTRQQIERELLEWMTETRRAEWPIAEDDERFADLALRLFAFQFEACPPYARFCEARGVTPENIGDWVEIPPVPTGAFKEVALRCFPEDATIATFRTSGTSGTSRTGPKSRARGQLHLDDLSLYEASLMASLDGLLLPDLWPGEVTTIRVLAASPDEVDDSSLSHMFGRLLAERGNPASGFDIVGGRLQIESLETALEAAYRRHRPVTLCGTAFAFVHLLDTLEASSLKFELAVGSRVMETGGFKGRSREIPRDELTAALSHRLGIPAARILNQYGMTELGSQFYDSLLVDPDGPRRKLGPPWARVRLVDPISGLDAAEGAVGMIVVHDLANTGSVAAVQTADLARRIPDRRAPGFEVIGRQPGAEERGCSIAADLMLDAS